MLNKIAVISTVLQAITAASSLPKTWYSLDQLARFDNSAGLPLVAASPIGIYLDIFWQGMSLAQTGGLQNIAIVVPNSPPNVAAYSALDLVTVQQGQPSMMTNYADSTIDNFDLKSIYYGWLSCYSGICGSRSNQLHSDYQGLRG